MNVKPPVASNPVPSNSLERGLKILEMIGSSKNGLSNREISEELHIATSSCSYVLGRLEREGYLERNAATGRYQIGLKVLAISRGRPAAHGLPRGGGAGAAKTAR